MAEKEKTENTGASTLAHELVAREEQNIGIFFAAFSIQFYMTREMLKQRLNKPVFLNHFGDVEVFASQRIFIKNIIINKYYQNLCEEIEYLLIEHNNDDTKQPHELLLSRINKAFLIRQIFKQTDQVLPKYHFVEDFLGQEINNIDMDILYKKMETLPVEQQILVLSRIFTQVKDSFENKKKPILASFIENVMRVKNDYVSKGRTATQEYSNLEMLMKCFG